MPDGAGGNNPDPEVERKLRELKEEISNPKTREPTPLERLVAAREAEKRVQRKRDTRVLAVLGLVGVVIVGGGVFAWLRFAPPSRHHHASAAASASVRTTASVRATAAALSTASALPNPTAPRS